MLCAKSCTPAAKQIHPSAHSPSPRGTSLTSSAQIEALTGDPNFMTSLARGLAVIQGFSERRHQLTVSQLSVKTGFSRAAVRRCLYTLTKLGFACSDDGRHFFLRPRILTLGHSYLSSMPLAAAVQPVLEHVSHLLHEPCFIATFEGLEIVSLGRDSRPGNPQPLVAIRAAEQSEIRRPEDTRPTLKTDATNPSSAPLAKVDAAGK